ncbi:F-box only protein [Trifolium repens]|nr:F-box only protein [Trifolium repens]
MHEVKCVINGNRVTTRKITDISCNPVSIDDTLYFMHFGPEGIVSCNTSTGVWTQHLLQVPLDSSDIELAESGGQMMLVGLLTENDVTRVCIWELQKVTFLLKEVDRRQFSEFQGRPVGLTCLGNKGLLLCYSRSPNMYHMVTYNVATRKWAKVCLPYGRTLQEYWSVARGKSPGK